MRNALKAKGIDPLWHAVVWDEESVTHQIKDAEITVVGQLCTPKDVLATDAPVARVRVGDWLIFPYAGAYAWHISHHDFLLHPHPERFYLPVEAPSAWSYRTNNNEDRTTL